MVIAEASWFLSSYLSAIEHYRSDLSILYQPRILFPGYFESFTLSEGNETIFTNDALRYSHDPEPQWKLLQRLIVSVAPNAPLSIEPSLVINEYLRESVTLDERGNAMLIPGVSTRFSPEYLVHKEELYSGFRDQVMQLPESISDDGMSSLENSVYNEAHLLFVTGQKREAIALLISICFPNGKNICSPYADENLKRLKGLS